MVKEEPGEKRSKMSSGALSASSRSAAASSTSLMTRRSPDEMRTVTITARSAACTDAPFSLQLQRTANSYR